MLNVCVEFWGSPNEDFEKMVDQFYKGQNLFTCELMKGECCGCF